jgi:hypothetical protein
MFDPGPLTAKLTAIQQTAQLTCGRAASRSVVADRPRCHGHRDSRDATIPWPTGCSSVREAESREDVVDTGGHACFAAGPEPQHDGPGAVHGNHVDHGLATVRRILVTPKGS